MKSGVEARQSVSVIHPPIGDTIIANPTLCSPRRQEQLKAAMGVRTEEQHWPLETGCHGETASASLKSKQRCSGILPGPHSEVTL